MLGFRGLGGGFHSGILRTLGIGAGSVTPASELESVSVSVCVCADASVFLSGGGTMKPRTPQLCADHLKTTTGMSDRPTKFKPLQPTCGPAVSSAKRAASASCLLSTRRGRTVSARGSRSGRCGGVSPATAQRTRANHQCNVMFTRLVVLAALARSGTCIHSDASGAAGTAAGLSGAARTVAATAF